MAEVPSIRVTQQESHTFLCNVLEQTTSSLDCIGFGVGLAPPEQDWCQRTAYP